MNKRKIILIKEDKLNQEEITIITIDRLVMVKEIEITIKRNI